MHAEGQMTERHEANRRLPWHCERTENVFYGRRSGGCGPLGSHSSGDLFATSALPTVSKLELCISTQICLVSVHVLTVSSLTRVMLKASGRPICNLFNDISRSNYTSSEDGVLNDYFRRGRGKERFVPIWGNMLYRRFVWRDAVIRRRT